MTVAALTQTRVQISGDGVTDRVDVTFQFVDETDLKVIHTDNEGIDTEWVFQESPGNWYFSGGEYTSGTIHFSASDLATGERLTVLLTSQYDQVLSLDGGEIDPSVLERGMDRAALQIQAIAGDVSRSFRIAPSAEGDLPDLEVPDLPDGFTFVREGDALVPALLDSNEIGVQVAAAQTARAAAETALTAAETAEANAETAESNAGTAAGAASSSATSATGSASAAASAATAAASSASSASSSAMAAETAETNAETAESNASSSASSASSSASSASSSATAASGSASSASSSASSASSSATAAASSATSAASSATAASAAQTAAEAAQAAAEAATTGTAVNTTFTPAGSLVSTNVQAALEELDGDVGNLQWTYEAVQSLTSGDFWDFSGIAEHASEIELVVVGCQLSGANNLLVRLGDAGGFESSGYYSVYGYINGNYAESLDASNGFLIRLGDSAIAISFVLKLSALGTGGKSWAAELSGKRATAGALYGFGRKNLTERIDRVRLTGDGSNTGVAGNAYLRYR